MIEEDGNTNAREYVAKCARAFGMFAHQREDSLNAELTRPEPSDYYSKALAKARVALADVRKWTPEEILTKHAAYVQEITESNVRSIARAAKINARYQAVLAKLDEWKPEDEVSQNVKDYAIKQINMCYPVNSFTSEPELDANKWYSDKLDRLKGDVEYYLEHVEDELERNAERNIAITNFFAELEKIPE